MPSKKLEENAYTMKKYTKVCKKKEEKQVKYGIYLCMLEEDDDRWYIDSGCSHHMLGDKIKFLYLKKTKDGHVILEENTPAKVLGKGKAKLGDKNTIVVDLFRLNV